METSMEKQEQAQLILIQMNKNNRILIIPARSGSQRLKNKNSKIFFSKPIITYSIESALNSKLFKNIIVSSNDKIIKEITFKYKKKNYL